MEHLNSPITWLAAAVLAIILSASPLLDGPDDIVVMQLVADEHTAVQTHMLVLP